MKLPFSPETKAFIETLTELPAAERVAYVNAHPEQLNGIQAAAMDEIGRLLCHASSDATREESPILRDAKKTKQAEFETGVFGDDETQGTFAGLNSVAGIAAQ